MQTLTSSQDKFLTRNSLDPLPQILQKHLTSHTTPPSPHHHPLSQFISNNHGRSIQSTLTLLTASQPLKHKHQPPNPRALDLPSSPQRSRRPPRDPAHLLHRRPLCPNHALNSLPLLLSSVPTKPKEPLSSKEQIEYTSVTPPTTSVRCYNPRRYETAEGSYER